MGERTEGAARSVEPLGLLRRYRTLCEAAGLARASRLPLAEGMARELASLEQQLAELLDGQAPDKAAGESPRPESAPRSITATIFTDGAAEGNPGPGGYCALVRLPGRPDRELSGGTNHTTNNQMELTAAIVGVGYAIDAGASDLSVISDSEYLIKGMTHWLPGWLAKGWKTAAGQPVKNRELWEQLAQLMKNRSIRWEWIRGHAGHPENERCDQVATRAAREAGRT